MTTLKDTAPVSLLLTSVSAQYADVRIWAINELALRGVTDAVPAIIIAAQDGTSAVRDAAIKALGHLCDPTGRASLVELLPRSAILVLARLGDARAIPPLSTIVTDKKCDHFVRIEAANALREISEPACVDALLNVMPDTQLHGRSGDWARSILLRIGSPAIDQLITALTRGGAHRKTSCRCTDRHRGQPRPSGSFGRFENSPR
jgi:HEAT repeat protein